MTDVPILEGCSVLPPLEPGPEPEPEPSAPKPKTRKAADRFKVLNAFVDYGMADLKMSDVLVWLVLYRDTKDGIAQTGQADIARRVGIHKRTVQWAIKRLEAAGHLKVVRRGGLNQGLSAYRVLGMPRGP